MRTATEALDWAEAHPNRDGKTWSQWCQSFIVRALDLDAAGDANVACKASTIAGTNPADAPAGALHWWLNDGETSGHVGISLGGAEVLMTDAPTADQWAGHNTVGVTTVARYNAKQNGYKYVGWSRDMAGQQLKLTAAPKPLPAGKLPKTTTEQDGAPGLVFWARFQLWAARQGYVGPRDGKPGPNTWKAAQLALRQFGYTGPADGKPGVNTYKALQRLAARYGYAGPIDGVPGPNTWRGVARFLNTL
ncbi:peptidoglycan-binding domain-containing protein [Agromyces sp. S2-1-8]|uniref:peptidoglycan-binding domain-containing protein n=1 Tax=Agromyces sp. S2-1-8 TaxID=2897180 RepID=UPI001E408CE4|nr:peptidoglycan-binding domain-containing protein [Agromyces sp. S2-1-8]MCD5345047.1 peptidoglycan-binding protein [Agromyces sp. S2-1-8]